jgi:hypothetical protein
LTVVRGRLYHHLVSRRPQGPRSVALFVATLLIGTTVASPAILGTPLQSACRQRQLSVLSEAQQTWLLDGDQPVARLPTSSGESYRHLVATEGGWLLAGDRSDGSGGTEIFVLRNSDGVQVEGTVPADRRASRLRPRLLTRDGQLQGMVWLEGDGPRSLGVRAARWTEGVWSSPTWVSVPGRSSQTALSAIVLGDGSWLTVWSAFDGRDDEVVYSRLTDGTWSAPQRVSADNRVPDVTPALAPTRGGALVAWSRYDGHDYRLRIARFEEDGWRDEEWLGDAGSAFPSFHLDCNEGGDGAALLFRSSGNDSWSLLDFSARGRLLSRTDVPNERRQRPIVHLHQNGRSTLDWLRTDGGGTHLSPAQSESQP